MKKYKQLRDGFFAAGILSIVVLISWIFNIIWNFCKPEFMNKIGQSAALIAAICFILGGIFMEMNNDSKKNKHNY